MTPASIPSNRQATAQQFVLAEPAKPVKFGTGPFHDDIVLIAIEKGRLENRTDGAEATYGAGTLLLFWSSIPHDIFCPLGETKATVIHLPLALYLSWALPAEMTQSLMSGTVFADENPSFPSESVTIINRCCSEIQNGGEGSFKSAYFELQAHLWRLVRKRSTFQKIAADVSRSPTMPVSIAARTAGEMASFITRNFKENIKISDVLSSTPFSQTHALRLFKNRFGVRPVDYLTRHRLLYACHLLRGNEHRVNDIAKMSGFGSVSRFFAVFKSKFGVSPNVYRQRQNRPNAHRDHLQSRPVLPNAEATPTNAFGALPARELSLVP